MSDETITKPAATPAEGNPVPAPAATPAPEPAPAAEADALDGFEFLDEAGDLPAKKENETPAATPATDPAPAAAEGEEESAGDETPADEGKPAAEPVAAKADEPAPAKPAEPSGDPDLKTVYQKRAAAVKAEVERIFGEPYDEFNDAHVAARDDINAKIRRHEREQVETKAKQEQAITVVAKALGDAATAEMTPQKINDAIHDLPHREFAKIQEALANGDPSLALEAIKKVTTKRVADEKAKRIAAKKTEPVAMIGAGSAAPAPAGGDDTNDGFAL